MTEELIQLIEWREAAGLDALPFTFTPELDLKPEAELTAEENNTNPVGGNNDEGTD